MENIKTIKELIDIAFPKMNAEEMQVGLLHIILEANADSKRRAEKESWMLLCEKVFDSGLMAEFCDFYLENPELSMSELYRQFCNEWDL